MISLTDKECKVLDLLNKNFAELLPRVDKKQLISQYCQQFKMGGIITGIDQLIIEAEASKSGYMDYTARLLGIEAGQLRGLSDFV